MDALESFRKRIPLGPLTFPERAVNILPYFHCSMESHCSYYLLSVKSPQIAEPAIPSLCSQAREMLCSRGSCVSVKQPNIIFFMYVYALSHLVYVVIH